MELTRILQLLWTRRAWVVLGIVVAALAAVLTSYRLSLSPLELQPRTSSYGSATTQVFVDSQKSSIATLAGDNGTLASRSNLLAQFLTSTEARADISQRMGLPANSIPVISSPNTVQQAQSENAPIGDQVVGGSAGGYSITFQPQLDLPIIDIYARGPDAAGAVRLADIAAESLSRQVARLSDAGGVARNSPQRIVMREIGPATGNQISNQVDSMKMIVTFLGLFLVWCIGVVFATWLRADWRRTSRSGGGPAPAADQVS